MAIPIMLKIITADNSAITWIKLFYHTAIHVIVLITNII
jgi:hypothetical protein